MPNSVWDIGLDRLKKFVRSSLFLLFYHQEKKSWGPKEGEAILFRVLYQTQMKLISFLFSRLSWMAMILTCMLSSTLLLNARILLTGCWDHTPH
jgi:hypothetical protein